MGFFLVIDGCDGIGKSTTIASLKTTLVKKGKQAASGHPMRTVIEKAGQRIEPFDFLSQMHGTGLFTDDLLDSCVVKVYNNFLQTIVKPVINGGDIFISDRFNYSNVVYEPVTPALRGSLSCKRYIKSKDLMKTTDIIVDDNDMRKDLTPHLDFLPDLTVFLVSRGDKMIEKRHFERFERKINEAHDQYEGKQLEKEINKIVNNEKDPETLLIKNKLYIAIANKRKHIKKIYVTSKTTPEEISKQIIDLMVEKGLKV